ncbi:MAG: phospho-sugar mutase [Candidatus Izemoplasmatales bacterium]|nr:phospho-sugar mutase [Candidatus Izemoplasmatales bacterium]MDY0138480.1 phospho-sugar mutase [Candidatus Izemoplasmatales bacterium]
MWKDEYKKWIDNPNLDTDLRNQLLDKDELELEDMFYTSLSFGTGGMRGIIGPGTNRLNLYTIRKANNGLAKYLINTYSKLDFARGVVIAHDNRYMSKEFARESARVLGAYGIKSYIFSDLRPTPELSYAVRHLNALAGIVVTASHNPPNYNGYKIYDEYGCQYTPKYAEKIIEYVNETKDIFKIDVLSIPELENNKLLEFIDEEIDKAYLDLVKSITINKNIEKKLNIVFTPLHGTSGYLGKRLLTEEGFSVNPVEEQMVVDPNFSTVKLPNPEEKDAYELALVLAKRVNADLIIATDPDADRLGIAVYHKNEYKLLNGNQTGALLIYYILTQKSKLNILPKKGVVFNTIVTSDLGAKIARSFGYDVISTLTGFKFIGEQARYLENDEREFIFGYEESYGYVINDEVRDKDSLQAMLMISEAANYYLVKENKTLYDVLLEIYEKYGFYLEGLKNVHLLGKEGQEKISRIMSAFRDEPLRDIDGVKIIRIEDFLLSKRYENKKVESIDLDKSNVLKYYLEDESWFVLRPSGTEPKLKIYAGVIGRNLEKSKHNVDKLLKSVLDLVEKVE